MVSKGYMSGGAGYILSRRALDKFVKVALNNTSGKLCRKDDDGDEDVEMGMCLQNINVTAGDSRDEHGKPRFFALSPDFLMYPGSKKLNPGLWYWKYQYYTAYGGDKCCSEIAIAFHYISPPQMYVLDFFAYKLKIFGIK